MDVGSDILSFVSLERKQILLTFMQRSTSLGMSTGISQKLTLHVVQGDTGPICK